LPGEAQPKANRQLPGEVQPKASRAYIEVTTWVTKHAGGDGTGSKLFDEPIERGDTPRTLLRRFTARFPELDSALWSPDHSELGSHIEVLVNDEVLGVTYELDTPLIGEERITLLGQFMGG
jgi:hypothetical protein